jgi:hypothetical protein
MALDEGDKRHKQPLYLKGKNSEYPLGRKYPGSILLMSQLIYIFVIKGGYSFVTILTGYWLDN